MGGLSTQLLKDFIIHRFTEVDEVTSSSWLAVVVVWRRGDGRRLWTWRTRLKAWRHRIGMDLLNAPFSIGRDAGLWFGYTGPLGEHETLFHARRRVVRVLGKEFEVPQPGQTLLLFLDEPPRSGRKATILVRSQRSEMRRETSDTAASVSMTFGAPWTLDGPLMTLASTDEQIRAFLSLDSESAAG